MKRHGEKKEKSTAEKAFDEQTRVLLQKSINIGLVDSYGGIIATGKEAVVIHATGGTERPEDFEHPLPAELAVKGFGPKLFFRRNFNWSKFKGRISRGGISKGRFSKGLISNGLISKGIISKVRISRSPISKGRVSIGRNLRVEYRGLKFRRVEFPSVEI